MADYDEVMNGLRAQARQVIGRNALTLAPYEARPTRAATPPEKQWWNFAAKYDAAKRIKAEVLRDYPGWNDDGDALRHAELSRRLASEVDPVTAYLAGGSHEIDNTIPESWQTFAPPFLKEHAKDNWHGQGKAERLMDLRNNAEGRRAAAERRPVDPTRLQTRPGDAAPTAAPYQSRPTPGGR